MPGDTAPTLALAELTQWPVESVAAAVLRRQHPAGRVEVVETFGDTSRRYRWASLTKLCTALAVLVAAEEGTLDLDLDAGPPGSTVSHLLAHASGLGPLGDVLSAPNRRRIYSNAGYEVLGFILEERSDLAAVRYIHEAVLAPLAMQGAVFEPAGSPAHGLSGTVIDLMALATELLVPTLVSMATLGQATSVAFPGLAGVLPGFGRQEPCDWGLGFELRDAKTPHWTGSRNSAATFGHFGQSGGFLWVDPEPGIACAVLGDRPFGPWATTLWPQLSDSVLAHDAIRA